MNAIEATKLLAILSTVDKREFDATTAQGWAWALDDIPYSLALAAAKKALTHGYVDIPAIQKQIRTMRLSIESDVRAAKLRGLIPDEWPRSQPLPDAVMDRLADARKQLFEANNDYPDEIAEHGRRPELDR